MTILPFKATYPNIKLITSPDEFFGSVKMEFSNYYKNGFFQECEQESLFVYRIQNPEAVYNGIIACSALSDFKNKKILKHENTLAAKEQKMINILLQNEGMVKPILMTYPKNEQVENFIEKTIDDTPFIDVYMEENREKHTLWKISNPKDLNELQEAFQNIAHMYIADGHHRTSTALRLLESQEYKGSNDRLLSVYFSSSNLSVYDYNRIINFRGLISPTYLVARLSQFCKIAHEETPVFPKGKHTMGMYIQGEYFRLKWKKKYTTPSKTGDIVFDTQLINDHILNDIMGIEKVRDNPRITYVSGMEGVRPLQECTATDEYTIALALYPISIDELMYVADTGKTLPPKSTWFEPRIKNGLVAQLFNT